MARYLSLLLFVSRWLVPGLSIDPCLSLSQAFASKNQSREFPPSEVLACLRTVPINETLSSAQIDWYRNFIQFQTTLSYLQNPPSSYDLPAINILGGLDAIQSNIKASRYDNSFDFELDLSNLVTAAYDGHFAVNTQLTSQRTFSAIRNVELVSISSDGNHLPKVYFIGDLTDSKASDLISIDGVEVNEAIERAAFNLQNRDALYNSMCYSLPSQFFGAEFTFDQSQVFIQEDTTTYEFRNGTKQVIKNSIGVNLNLKNITSGQDIYDKFLLPSNAKSGNSTQDSSSSAQTSDEASTAADSSSSAILAKASKKFPRSGYPTPLYANLDFILAGYFLPNSTDTCVMSILGFEDPVDTSFGAATGPNATAFGLDFQNVAKSFFAACKTENRTKLLIDVRSNAGGMVELAYDLFKQLFPTRTPYSGMRFRAHPAADAIGTVISSLRGTLAPGDDGELEPYLASPFDFNNSLSSPSEKPFESWSDLYGPQTVHMDNFTNLLSWKFSDVALDLATNGIVPSGYANNTDVASQPFADEDITLITDGQCGSTCSIFVNLLLTQSNMSTIAFGGRPTRDPMAVVGGVEGAQVMTYQAIVLYASAAVELLSNSTELAEYTKNLTISKEQALSVVRPLVAKMPLQVAGSYDSQTVNFRDQIAQNDPTQTPYQFAQPIVADCRAFYLLEDIVNVTNTWERVAQGKVICVDGGSLGQKRGGNGTAPVAPYTGSATSSHKRTWFSCSMASVVVCLFALIM